MTKSRMSRPPKTKETFTTAARSPVSLPYSYGVCPRIASSPVESL